MQVRIIDNVIVDIARGPDGTAVDPATLFGPDLAKEFTDLAANVPAGIGPQWRRGQDGAWTAPPAPIVVKTPKALPQLDFVRLVMATASLSLTDFSAISADPNLAGMWRLLGMADTILPSDPLTSQGLDAMVATGHLTAAQKAAVLAAWPTV